MAKKDKKKPTIADVAKSAGVERSLVSKALLDDKSISYETKLKVLRAAKKLNFKSDHVKKQAAGGKTNTLAIVASFFWPPFFRELIHGFEQKVIGNDYNLALFSTKGVNDNEREVMQRILHRKMADAVITLNLEPDRDVLQDYKESKTPLISIERELKGFASIMTDNASATYKATDYLIKKGRKNVGIVIGKRYTPDIQNERIKGYMLALDENGIEYRDDNMAIITQQDIYAGVEIFRSFFKQRRDIDSILCLSGDYVAAGIMHEAMKSGVRVPEDLAVIGYDDLEIASFTSPEITTIRQPANKIGEAAFNLAVEGINTGKRISKKVIIDSELVVRESA